MTQCNICQEPIEMSDTVFIGTNCVEQVLCKWCALARSNPLSAIRKLEIGEGHARVMHYRLGDKDGELCNGANHIRDARIELENLLNRWCSDIFDDKTLYADTMRALGK